MQYKSFYLLSEQFFFLWFDSNFYFQFHFLDVTMKSIKTLYWAVPVTKNEQKYIINILK